MRDGDAINTRALLEEMGAQMNIVFSESLHDESLSDVVSREAVLWVTDSEINQESDIAFLAKLIAGPWRAVFVEASSGELASALQTNASALETDRWGFSHVIASDPSAIVLQRRAKPVFFLNGLADRTGAEGVSLTQNRAKLRRWNMTATLRNFEPRRIVLLGSQPSVAVEDLVDLWQSDFRTLLTIASEDRNSASAIGDSLSRATDLPAIEWIDQPFLDFVASISGRLTELAEDARTVVSAQLPGGRRANIDLVAAEAAELPLSDTCEFISLRDTLPVSPNDLSFEEFQKFFARSEPAWRAYAAGLPWIPDREPERCLLAELNRQLSEPPSSVQVLSIVSEAGAGGTTQARALAFAAAKTGFPAILVKQHSDVPSALELTNFLFRATQLIGETTLGDELADPGGPVWVLVLDAQHCGRGTDDLVRLCAELGRSGRRVAILKVVRDDAPLTLPDSIAHKELVYVGHDLGPNDVDDLGKHLNVYLRQFGRAKSPQEWQRFWHVHRPDVDVGFASFWIALEFWLAGYLDMGESIQSWVLRQFKALSGESSVKRSLLEIAAFSVERRAVPERLLGALESPRLPWSTVLEAARRSAPGVGLVQSEAIPYGRVWAVAHDILARYLLNAVWNDRPLSDLLALGMTSDPVDLRLSLIERLATRTEMSETFAQPFAVALATSVLKLDERVGNAEFFPHWRKVLAILESVPESVRYSSRAFNHHLAISRRRVTQDDLFHLAVAEKRTLLHKAVQEVEFALDRIDPTPDDEGDLYLLNTLALLYQDLAKLERGPDGDRNRLAQYLGKSDEVTNRALKHNPNSPYVLETAAKNLLRQRLDMADESEKVMAAAKALSFVFQASRLDSVAFRRMSLGLLASEALRALRAPEATQAVEKLCSQGSPYGYVAKAWRALPVADDDEATLMLDSIDAALASDVAELLNESPERDWLLVRLQYDLVVIARPLDFSAQLRLLDELSATKGYQLSLQQSLERAVLLHMEGQHKAGTEEFRTLRPRIKASQTVVYVPPRLRWLLTPDRAGRAVCTARAIDSVGEVRGMANVSELGGTFAPFSSQEFGKARMAPNEQFKCCVTFAAMGPFLKPVNPSHR
ncbi:hypothetical protein PQR52_09760 [Paraburkholderia aspalathi]|uniref:hypothetical protein n=1 Tax=Paraburkholderia aspalathi TaxID=1324617 RepID=UPI0038B8754D